MITRTIITAKVKAEIVEKTVGYIPVGSAITSYARNFTIRHAIANYERFCYADTDSIHLQGLDPAEMVIVDPVEFCRRKNECDFDFAYYVRQKTYAEHVIAEDVILLKNKTFKTQKSLDKKVNPVYNHYCNQGEC